MESNSTMEGKSLWLTVAQAAAPLLVRALLVGLLTGLVLAGLLPVAALDACLPAVLPHLGPSAS